LLPPGSSNPRASKNIEKINSLGVEQVVTACSGCYGIMKLSYSELAPLEPRVLHISELLAALVEDGRIKLGPVPRRVTYHDPCHLACHGGITGEPRRLLEAIPGLELIEIARTGKDALGLGDGLPVLDLVELVLEPASD